MLEQTLKQLELENTWLFYGKGFPTVFFLVKVIHLYVGRVRHTHKIHAQMRQNTTTTKKHKFLHVKFFVVSFNHSF